MWVLTAALLQLLLRPNWLKQTASLLELASRMLPKTTGRAAAVRPAISLTATSLCLS
jgi:hypothetical protein